MEDYNKYILSNSIGYQISSTARLVNNRLNANFKENDYPVTNEQYSIMIRLWVDEGLTQSRLATLTGRDQANVSKVISNLEKKDLVMRTPHPVDKRTNLIFLTSKGKKMQLGLIEQAKKTIEEMSDGIDEDDLKSFMEILLKIKGNLIKHEVNT
ncbi:MarR family winged helix-turn-helix transcriptional regulator [Evansella cellulosilytica]|uniref:Transcriptional regulator, MarR family n=1 Tax=Evansella cellulosilytica (strain ATCC 21833 / DSM 2522 / FERM P-1141 / JCM 9156 / N-4) TaxID=649639 RepID=E6TVW2_EVAC2|nr:MarR family transcriptional regulator [Evansella cellulosilytica]ADU28671.1 transcriptional regulator, MarR family [Evansella cellulosilytica DSM 2522]